jgi:hypothetical protein
MKLIKTSILALLFIAPPCMAGELVPARIPASAKWLLHADMEAMRDSETGKRVFAAVEAASGDKLRAFKRMFSLHPIEDLSGVTLFGDGGQDHAVALIEGKFDRGHIEDVLKGAEDHSTADHADVMIHSWRDNGVMQHAAFVNDGLMVFSRQERLLRQSLDVLKDGGAAPIEDVLFTAGKGRALLDARARLSELNLPADASRLLSKIRGMGMTAVEEDGRFAIRMSMETADQQDAERVRRVLDGVFALAEMENPDIEKMNVQGEIQKTEGFPGLSVGVSLPVAQWISMLEKLGGK